MLYTEVLCCTILTHISDLEVKVMDFEILCLSFCLKFLEVNIFWSVRWILLILDLILDTGLRFTLHPTPTPSLSLRSRSLTLNVILHWSFWLKFLEVDISWTFNWIYLILCMMLDIGLKFYSVPSPCRPPPHWPWGQGHRECFLFNEMFISHQSVIRKHSYFKQGLLPFHN